MVIGRACSLARLSETAWYYAARKDSQEGLRMRIREIANGSVRFPRGWYHVLRGVVSYPNEVEDALCSHPDVIEAAVIGLPDADGGELVKAYIVTKNL